MLPAPISAAAVGGFGRLRGHSQYAESGSAGAVPGEALGVNLSYLDAALEQLHDSHGSIEQYFSRGLGLSNQTIDALRDRLIS